MGMLSPISADFTPAPAWSSIRTASLRPMTRIMRNSAKAGCKPSFARRCIYLSKK